MIPNVLTIAGVDPSGGAGVLADIKAISANGAYAASVITALTAQNTRGVSGVELVDARLRHRARSTPYSPISASMPSRSAWSATAEIAARSPSAERHGAKHIVLDPVMIAKSGDRLLAEDAVAAIRDELIPLAEVITPNLPEAARCSAAPSRDVAAMRTRPRRLLASDRKAVLLKGGHLDRDATDVLLDANVSDSPRRASSREHPRHRLHAVFGHRGAAAGICAARRRSAHAKAYLTEAIRTSGELSVGSGHGPLHHFHGVKPR